MVFGVEKDAATVCGLDGIDPLRNETGLTQVVRSIITRPATAAYQHHYGRKMILLLALESGIDRGSPA